MGADKKSATAALAVRMLLQPQGDRRYLLAREDPPPSGGGMKARNEEPRHACGFLRLRRLRSGLSRDTFSPCEKRKRLRGVATARTRPRSPPPLGGWETHAGTPGVRSQGCLLPAWTDGRGATKEPASHRLPSRRSLCDGRTAPWLGLTDDNALVPCHIAR